VYIDSSWGRKLNDEINNKSKSVGFDKDNDLSVNRIKSFESETLIDFKIANVEYSVRLPFIGPNCEMNYLLAVGMAHFSDTLSMEQIISNTKNVNNPKGRFEKFTYKQNDIFVDYAHTPEAIERAILLVKDKYKEVIVILGAGGNRDLKKRSFMGKAANHADEIIITNDNPRKEDPMFIAKEVLAGVDLNKKVEIILDRKVAIKKGLDSLRGNSVLLVLGKGHEKTQELKDGIVKFDDSEVINNLIEDMK
jgi:UDP-N-acetylmuramoyl-L-alanyl-D-glutamate--2,6-diaminopimelate ligase